MQWAASEARPVLIGRDGNILRLYWMPVLLRLDEFRAAVFIQELNGVGTGAQKKDNGILMLAF